ncbi:MAG: zinc ribbon domain-containing protein [Anaerolineales bacterium]|nr:zinc ribbon domain-containing protein [Anaerolineales bacterium]
MPTYAYRCESCSVEFERYQKFTDKPLSRCPECRGKVRRVPQAAGVVFKGSGWYVNDSKSSSSTLAKGAKKTGDEPAKADAPKTETPKTDSKPSSPASDA